MTPREKRIAIAEKCGGYIGVGPFDSIVFRTSDGRAFGDPLTDLNAMHEAEMTLSRDEYRWFCNHLREACCNDAAISAPADVRAQALLEAISKRNDTK